MTPPPAVIDQVAADRELLRQAQADGNVLPAYIKLSGPGWLQSAITLGGGSLAGALFLGVLGGTSMIWVQLLAITMGVVMLSAISYVTLTTGRRPFEAINSEINPALGWGWLTATAMANIIWCMPQFSLSYDALDNNLVPLVAGTGLGESFTAKAIVTLVLLSAAMFVVLLNVRRGKAAKAFDLFLKGLIGMVVICFVAVAGLLLFRGEINVGEVLAGIIPDLSQFSQPAGRLAGLTDGLPDGVRGFWNGKLAEQQTSVLIAAAATAVGINMTFLLPYSMLARGWDKPFRGLARFDLATGMAIPYILVTTCVVIASAASFHGRVDDATLSSDPSVMATSPSYGGKDGIKDQLVARIDHQLGDRAASVPEEEKLAMAANLSADEKRLASALVKRDAFQLSRTLSPLLGDSLSKLVFGLGVFGMGFSTIIILMLINGYVFREMMGDPDGTAPFVAGVLVAGLSGASWMFLWQGDSKFWLAIFASVFGAMLLPIAYVTFFLMMNSRRIMGSERPAGGSRLVWNVLMAAAVIVASGWAITAILGEAGRSDVTKYVVYGILIVYAGLLAWGFTARRSKNDTVEA